MILRTADKIKPHDVIRLHVPETKAPMIMVVFRAKPSNSAFEQYVRIHFRPFNSDQWNAPASMSILLSVTDLVEILPEYTIEPSA